MIQNRRFVDAGSNAEVLFDDILLSCHLRSIRLHGKILHEIQVMGRITLEQRLPLYRKTIEINGPGQYFCILDNQAGHENEFTFSDTQKLGSLLVEHGVTECYAVTVTPDSAYPSLVKVASASMETLGLKGALYTTGSRGGAESFILEKMQASR